MYDADTKLVRFGARDYNPEIGRWTAKDPVGFGGGQSNFYEYCLNDPVNSVDVSGLLRVSKNLAAKYPNIAKQILNMKSRLNQKMYDAFREYGQASKIQVDEALTEGKGPCVDIRDLTSWGLYDKTNEPEILQIDYLLFDLYNKGKATKQQVEAIVLHELTHYFDLKDGNFYPRYYEAGIAFEIWVYGSRQAPEW